MNDCVMVPIFHLNLVLAVSNAWVVYPMYQVVVSATLASAWRYGLISILMAQSIASATQHITERHCSPHRMCGTVCANAVEHGMLWADRAMAGLVSVAYICLIWSHVGIGIFMGSWYALYLAWCMGLIYVSDNHIQGSPLLYTMIHLVWHISIYSFLGDIVRWID